MNHQPSKTQKLRQLRSFINLHHTRITNLNTYLYQKLTQNEIPTTRKYRLSLIVSFLKRTKTIIPISLLIRIILRNPIIIKTFKPAQIIHYLENDQEALAPDLIKKENQKIRDNIKKAALSASTGVKCPSCSELTFYVEFVRKPSGQGRKCVDVRLASCSSCNYKETD